jgi:N-acetylmuramic acid 6-phosphate (MurNAc-6-P) etherase
MHRNTTVKAEVVQQVAELVTANVVKGKTLFAAGEARCLVLNLIPLLDDLGENALAEELFKALRRTDPKNA